MLSGSWARYAPLAGILFVALLVASFILSGSSPDTDDSTGKVVAEWSKNDSQQMTGAILSALAVVPFLWFLGALRSALRVAEGGTGRLSATAFAGGLILAGFAVADASLQFAVADSVGDVPPLVTQSLSVLYSDFFLGFPVGVGVFGVATGLVLLRTGLLPAWLGWFIFVVGILSFIPFVGFFGIFLVFAWIIVVSIMLFQRGDAAAPPAPTAPAGI
jgi:hypothetical protein